MLLLLDNGSVYTRHLADLLENGDIPFEVRQPDGHALDKLDNFDAFILSGRRRNDKLTNAVNSRIVLHAIQHEKKLFGICYGAEILALALGGSIIRSPVLQKGSETVMIHGENPLCSGKIDVFESHKFEICRLPEKLVTLGGSARCKHELVCHEAGRIFGSQFHPEMSPDGRRLIERFCHL